MPSPFSSLLLAMSLAAPQAGAAAQPATAVPASQGTSTSASVAKAGAAATPKAKRTAKTAPASKLPAAKSPATKTADTMKDAKPESCDTAEPTAVAAKPAPVPANPFAPVVAPCTEPKP